MLIENLARDVRHALRTLRHWPGFSTAVVLTLALCIGTSVAMFSLVNAIVLHPLPYPKANRILSLSETNGGNDLGVLDEVTYTTFSEFARSVGVAAYQPTTGMLGAGTDQRKVTAVAATSAYFDILGVSPSLGRVFDFADEGTAGPMSAMISEQLWRGAFGSSPAIVGSTIILNGRPALVTGVMPASFTTGSGPQLWLPLQTRSINPGVTRFWNVTGRLRKGATVQQAKAELAALAANSPGFRVGASARSNIVVMTLADRLLGSQRRPALLLFGAVMTLFLVACANLAHLAVVRAANRSREFAVRMALGGGRGALARMLLTESGVLAAIGAALGLGISVSLVRYFALLGPAYVGDPDRVRVDAFVVAFALIVVTASAIGIGLMPSLLATWGDMGRALSSATPRASTGPKLQIVTKALIVSQLATAFVLLVGAGLVAHSFWRATSIPLGFRPSGLVAFNVHLPQATYAATSTGYYERVMTRLRQYPDVESVALGWPPLSQVPVSYTATDNAGRPFPLEAATVGPGYFRTVGAHFVEGREFAPSDRQGQTPVAIVNATLAMRLFPVGDPVGRIIAGPAGAVRIVGVVADLRQNVERPSVALVYTDAVQEGIGPYQELVARTSGQSGAAEGAIANAIREIDPYVAPQGFKELDRVVAEVLAPREFTFVLMSLYAGTAALIAVIGLYSAVSRVVTERTREFGVRIALGASPDHIVGSVLRQGLRLSALGTTLGIALAIVGVRRMSGLLYDTAVYDPWSWGAVIGLLALVSILASYVPARRATRVDPATALRGE